MSCHEDHHFAHPHKHGENCGHKAVPHNGHTDYLHEGHLHHPHEGHVDEHRIGVTESTPVRCTPNVQCKGHAHEPGCGHDPVPHGDHVDYVVGGRMHHPHAGHCDDHGPLQLI
ncbi:MAG TPA: hypothetical protein VHY79_15405 [Rhizomicrobium sp.]|jgi:hypothetical protein|nr:hypothetical protein [Rhizomicrobium sp.]